MNRQGLQILFLAILLVMIWVTGRALLDRSVFDAGEVIADPWGLATLVDAYCGFVTFFAWVAYRETTWPRRILWLVLILGLGNIAMSIYMLLLLRRLGPDAGPREILLRPTRGVPQAVA